MDAKPYRTTSCPACKRILAGKLSRCFYCGASLEARTAPESSSPERCCPRCHRKLFSVPGQGLDVEACADCGGELYSTADLIRIEGEDPPEAQSIPELVDLTPSSKDRVPPLRCPLCSHEMDTFDVVAIDRAQVDVCHDCGAAWVDGHDAGAVRRKVREHLPRPEAGRRSSLRRSVIPSRDDPNIIDLSDLLR
ncbi:MAG: hypothetical protein HY815_23515 [Candidatus Riflebacteria bacterium]|nr:hypothetical protein [Candidatus Riflebacteria bacterium]